jgi:hypothetical protein
MDGTRGKEAGTLDWSESSASIVIFCCLFTSFLYLFLMHRSDVRHEVRCREEKRNLHSVHRSSSYEVCYVNIR